MSDTPDTPPTQTLHEGSLPGQAIGQVLSAQQVASITFQGNGVRIDMVSAPEHVLKNMPVVGITVPSKNEVVPERLQAQLAALTNAGLLGPAAKQLAEHAKAAAAQTQGTPDPVVLPRTVTLVGTPMQVQQVASTPTPLAPQAQNPIVVSDTAATLPVTPGPTPQGNWTTRLAAENNQQAPVRQL